MSLKSLIHNITDRPYYPEKRILNPTYFLDEELKSEYCKKGFVVVKNVVSDEIIEIIENTYNDLYGITEFYKPDGFMPSPRYGKTVQNVVNAKLGAVNRLLLPKLFNLDKCQSDVLNIFVVKETKAENSVIPHIDISLIDEYDGSSTFLWIPTCDINEDNGAMLFIPGSHLWAAWQRTHAWNVSPIEKNRDMLNQFMVPVYMNKGDLILFDSASIHGSLPNNSGKIRLAMNTSVCTKNSQLAHYVKNSKMPRKTIGKYIVDKRFYQESQYFGLDVPDRYSPIIYEEMRCYNTSLSKSNLKTLIDQYG